MPSAHRSAMLRHVLLLGSALALIVADQASAQTAPPSEDKKPPEIGSVTVTDTPIDDRESATGYKVSRTTSATRTDTPLIDVPQSVSVVTSRQINDQSATSIGDAIRYTPGIFSAQGEGNRETLLLRGNSTTGDFFVDGVRDDVQTYRDLYNIDRLEVFKGPNAMIFGRGGIGGLINRVTKAADGQLHLGGRIEGGSFEAYRGQVDLGTPIGDGFSVRLTGVYDNAGSYRDGVEYERWGLNPIATVKLGDALTITAGYEHFRDRRIADRGISSYLGVPLSTPRGRFFGDPARSPSFTNTDAGTLFVEYRFSDSVLIRNRTRYAEYDKFYQNVFPGTVNTPTVLNPAGLPAGSYAPGTIVQIQAYNNAMTRKNLINQTDLNARFSTGRIDHTLLIGAECGRQRTTNLRLEGFFPTTAAPTGVQTIFATVASPTISRNDIQWRAVATSGANRGIATVAAGYIQDQIAFSPMFDLIVGVRYEHFRTDVTDLRTVGFPAAQQRNFVVTDDLWSPRVGIIFKPVESAPIYAAYSRTYLPRGGDQLAGLNLTNQNLDPEKYQNYEIRREVGRHAQTQSRAGAIPARPQQCAGAERSQQFGVAHDPDRSPAHARR